MLYVPGGMRVGPGWLGGPPGGPSVAMSIPRHVAVPLNEKCPGSVSIRPSGSQDPPPRPRGATRSDAQLLTPFSPGAVCPDTPDRTHSALPTVSSSWFARATGAFAAMAPSDAMARIDTMFLRNNNTPPFLSEDTSRDVRRTSPRFDLMTGSQN